MYTVGIFGKVFAENASLVRRLQEDFSVLVEPTKPVDVGILMDSYEFGRVREQQEKTPLLLCAKDVSREEGTQFIYQGGDAFVDINRCGVDFTYNVVVRGATQRLQRQDFSRKKHVLVVSKNPQVFKDSRAVLAANNCWGIYAKDGDCALAKTYTVPIDSVFVDTQGSKDTSLKENICDVLLKTRLEVPCVYTTIASAIHSFQRTKASAFPFPRNFPTCMVFSGDSLAGKTSFSCRLVNQSSRFVLEPTYVTRLATYGEWSGDEHIFVSIEDFFNLSDRVMLFDSFRKGENYVAIPHDVVGYFRSFSSKYVAPSRTAILPIGSLDSVRRLQAHAKKRAPGSLIHFHMRSQGGNMEELARARGREGHGVKHWDFPSLSSTNNLVKIVNRLQPTVRYAKDGKLTSSLYLPTPELALYHGIETKELIEDIADWKLQQRYQEF